MYLASLLDDTLRCGTVFWDTLKPEPLPIDPSGAPGHKITENIISPGPVLVTAKEKPQTSRWQYHSVGKILHQPFTLSLYISRLFHKTGTMSIFTPMNLLNFWAVQYISLNPN